METHTTNIADLPIDHIPQNTELPENVIHSQVRMDREVYEEPRQKVSFNHNVEVRKIQEPSKIRDMDKIIIVATLLFIVLNDPMIKNYIMKVLVVIFGISLKTENGITSKTGNVMYGVFFGLVIYILTLVIDIPSLSF